jgi:protein-S-isoprenylcysteine O-methyltransferase Ste14
MLLLSLLQVAFEESLLVDRYGAAYQEYQKSVKKFFPYLY